jgi:hypothetical protein
MLNIELGVSTFITYIERAFITEAYAPLFCRTLSLTYTYSISSGWPCSLSVESYHFKTSGLIMTKQHKKDSTKNLVKNKQKSKSNESHTTMETVVHTLRLQAIDNQSSSGGHGG